MSNCLFCRIVRKEIPSKTVYEDDDVIAFRDINPQAPVHILVIPKKHIPGVVNLSSEDSELLGRLFNSARKIAEDEGITDSGFRLVINSGPDAGQAVDHLHIHLLGKRQLNWPPG